ncbi:MAG TPA: helix-turn-helix transcriptional regulator [Candidatus Saccharimonadia bacterium]|nr:helix-turn-helix transcriptional regulator [Candidatus Saccharimonadia bacterium]
MEIDPLTVLRGRLAKSTQVELGKELGVSQSIISLVLQGIRKPTPQLLNTLGIEKRITYHMNGRKVKK